jgi:hypothetical protein
MGVSVDISKNFNTFFSRSIKRKSNSFGKDSYAYPVPTFYGQAVTSIKSRGN